MIATRDIVRERIRSESARRPELHAEPIVANPPHDALEDGGRLSPLGQRRELHRQRDRRVERELPIADHVRPSDRQIADACGESIGSVLHGHVVVEGSPLELSFLGHGREEHSTKAEVAFTVTTGLASELRALLPGAIAGILLGVCSAIIMLDHPVEPLDPPMPTVDLAPLARIAREDRETRIRIDRQPLPPEARAIGSGFLEWNAAAASGMSIYDPKREAIAGELRSALAIARNTFGDELKMQAPLRDLRAYHTDLFMDELRRRERTRVVSDELKRLGGALLDVLVRNGWMTTDGRLLAPEAIVRARYKLHWTGVVFGLEDCETAAATSCYGLTTLPLDPPELRAMLAYLIAHPVVREEDALEAGSPERAIDRRRLLYIERLATLDRFADPTGKTHPYLNDYPYALAHAILAYRLGRYDVAERELGAYALSHKTDARARNWFLSAVAKRTGE